MGALAPLAPSPQFVGVKPPRRWHAQCPSLLQLRAEEVTVADNTDRDPQFSQPNQESQPSSHRPQYRHNDDERDPIPPEQRNDTRADTRFEARGDARENIGNNARHCGEPERPRGERHVRTFTSRRERGLRVGSARSRLISASLALLADRPHVAKRNARPVSAEVRAHAGFSAVSSRAG